MGTTASLKVVHLSSAHFAADTRILHKECKSLAKAGHDVTLVAAARGRYDFKRGKNQSAAYPQVQVEALDGCPMESVPRCSAFAC